MQRSLETAEKISHESERHNLNQISTQCVREDHPITLY